VTFTTWIVRWRVAVMLIWIGLTVISLLYVEAPEAGAGGGLKGVIPQRSKAVQAEIDSFRLSVFPF
jgi:hypothetical protein